MTSHTQVSHDCGSHGVTVVASWGLMAGRSSGRSASPAPYRRSGCGADGSSGLFGAQPTPVWACKQVITQPTWRTLPTERCVLSTDRLNANYI